MKAASDRRVLKRAITAVRGFPDRIRHRRRHAEVCGRVSELAMPHRLLVVCAGNICRSPYLEAVLKRDLPGVRIASAGFVGFNRQVPANALAAAARRGIDLSRFRSQTLEPHRARTADMVVVMDQRQARYLSDFAGVPRRRIIVAGDLDPSASASRAIEDPWKRPLDVFESTFDRLDRCASTLVGHLRCTASPSSVAARNAAQTPTVAVSAERIPQAIV